MKNESFVSVRWVPSGVRSGKWNVAEVVAGENIAPDPVHGLANIDPDASPGLWTTVKITSDMLDGDNNFFVAAPPFAPCIEDIERAL